MRKLVVYAITATALSAAPASAWPGAYGSSHSFGIGINLGGSGPRDDREGRISVSRYIAADVDPAALRHGSISVVVPDNSLLGGQAQDPFQGAVYQQLVRAGYQPAPQTQTSGQVAEVSTSRTLVQPHGPRPRPISGEAAAGVGTYGNYTALGVNVDLSKGAPALVATRLDTRIRDRATGKILWEGHAEMVTAEGDGKWTSERVAMKLADALFRDFPAHAQRS